MAYCADCGKEADPNRGHFVNGVWASYYCESGDVVSD